MARSKVETKQRNDLFASPPAPESEDEPELTTDELVSNAERMHNDTTRTARRALRVLEQTRVVQEETLNALQEQGQQLQTVPDKLEEVHEHLTFARKILNYMSRCFCFQFFDACTGADPDYQRKKEIEAYRKEMALRALECPITPSPTMTGYRREEPISNDKARQELFEGKPGAASQRVTGNSFRNPNIDLGPGYSDRAASMNEETRKQNEILGKIENGLDNLMVGAKALKSTLEEQEGVVDLAHDHFDKVEQSLHQVNRNKQLKHLKVKTSKPTPSIMPSWTKALS